MSLPSCATNKSCMSFARSFSTTNIPSSIVRVPGPRSPKWRINSRACREGRFPPVLHTYGRRQSVQAHRRTNRYRSLDGPQLLPDARGRYNAVLVIVPNLDRALHISYALGVTGDGHGSVNRLLVMGAATQPYDAILVGVNAEVCQTREVLGRQFGLDLGRDD